MYDKHRKVYNIFTRSSVLYVHRCGQKRASVQHGHCRSDVVFATVLEVFYAQFLSQREHFENSTILQNDLYKCSIAMTIKHHGDKVINNNTSYSSGTLQLQHIAQLAPAEIMMFWSFASSTVKKFNSI